MEIKKDAFNCSRVIVTGHTGFKGSWLSLWLKKMGAEVIGISDLIPTTPSHFEAAGIGELIKDIRLDIRDLKNLSQTISKIKPDYLFHLAAQPIVTESIRNPIETWNINTLGTANVLQSLLNLNNNCIGIFITSDKAYDNQEWLWGYKETDKIGGGDPYSASKGGAELAISSFYRTYFKNSNNIKIAIGRAGNVIGGGDWAANRIVPDCIRSWQKQEPVVIRNPYSTRPWQHVLEPLSGYLSMATSLHTSNKINGEAFNFGPALDENKTVGDVVSCLSSHFDYSKCQIEGEKSKDDNESKLLKLNCEKALTYLNWRAQLSFPETITKTALWYKNFLDNPENIKNFSISQISDYIERINYE